MNDISIVTAVLNGANTISDCIDSVSKQNRAVEHVIIDGGSTDGTLEILEKHRSALARVVSEKDRGIYDGMNKGLDLVSGDIVGFMNADDLYNGPDILSKVVRVLEDSTVDACYGDLVYVDPGATDRVVRYWKAGPFNYRRFYWGWMPPHPTFFVRKNVYEKYGYFNLALGSAADYELTLRFLLKYRARVLYIPEVLVKMRIGGLSNV